MLGGVQVLIELSAATARLIYHLGFSNAVTEWRYIRQQNKMFRKLPAASATVLITKHIALRPMSYADVSHGKLTVLIEPLS